MTLFGIAVLAASGWLAWAAFGPDSADGGGREFTYRNVSLSLPPEESGLHAVADYAAPEGAEKPGGGPVIVIRDDSEARSGYMVIDADTGKVLLDTIGGALRDEADDVKASIRQPKEDAAVWPLAEKAAVGPQVTWGVFSYVEPDPRSGIFVLPGTWDGPAQSGLQLFIHNGQSRMIVSVAIGESDVGELELDMTRVLPADMGAFERLAAAIKVDRTR